MLRAAAFLVLLSSAGVASAQSAAACSSLSAPAVPVQRTLIVPIASEFRTPGRQLGAPSGVLSQALSESLSAEQVIFRKHIESCAVFASIAPPASPASLPAATVAPAVPGSGAVPTATDPAAYKPRTEFDNTPWRFNMSENGQRMTADAFDEWMKAKGLQVVGGKFMRIPAAAAAPAVEADAAETPVQEQ
ncbi:hypothetical protein [Lysobacter sp. A03]|uniref:hypothetical protein n=1 Tax=Lysobacter sp. A03 TaxID=1199154 RepID=UPI0005B6D39B|nr:hypothetical protein [Lysobacter sp. A03]KIQ96069.1 hypothetical protein TI01_2463 [Lysobacter sp. A03]